MPTIIMSKPAGKLDASLKKKAYAFLEKLGKDDTTPGLHIEPIRHSADNRVRTGRVDEFWRAVLFRMTGTREPAYVFYGIWPHDEAIDVARKTRLKQNPVNGVTEIITVTPVPDVMHADDAHPDSLARPVPLLAGFGLDRKALVDVLGLDPSLAARALEAPDQDALLGLAGGTGVVEWQGLALLDLATGASVEQVQEKLGLDSVPSSGPAGAAGSAVSEDERLLEGLQHPAARMSFTWIEDNDELRRVIEDGDFGAWRVFLHPEQRKYATRSYAGPFRLSGGAGTGKTVVLLHRARMLARRSPSARVVVTTFTTNLAAQLRDDLTRLDPSLPKSSSLESPGVAVYGIDALANAVLRQAGVSIAEDAEAVLGAVTTAVTGRIAGSSWEDAIDAAGSSLPVALRSAGFLASEYAQVILPNRITSREAYFRVRRPGRGVALDRARRSAVWDVVTAYRTQARIEGTVDFAEAAAIAAAHLSRVSSSLGTFTADHVLVDEGQDLGPSHWQLLRALVGSHADDLFIAEDSHQRIYGQRVVLGRYGIRVVGRSQRLTLNYRTTAQNLSYAVGVLSGGSYVDLEDGAESAAGYRSARGGPVPRLLPCASLSSEMDAAASLLSRWLAMPGVAPETIAVLVPERWQRDRLVTGLADRGVIIRAVDRDQVRPGLPVVMTMHRAKGTEFSRVLLFGLDKGAIPRPLRGEQYAEDASTDALLRERSLLYVAATRARDELALSWTGSPSQLLPTQG